MTDRKPTDNEIIKALEERIKALKDDYKRLQLLDAPMDCFEESHIDNIRVLSNALDLINRKNVENERLNGENKAFGEIIKKQDDEISVLRKDLLKREDLEKSFSKAVKQFDKKLEKTVKLERAEAVKKAMQKLKARFESGSTYSGALLFVNIDIVLEEMAGDTE